jgi:exodeoxyribonuclease VII small subunit
MSEKPDYTQAFEELLAIVAEIEDGAISVDKLSEKVKRAAVLIKICKNKLTATEGDVQKILKELESVEKLDEEE